MNWKILGIIAIAAAIVTFQYGADFQRPSPPPADADVHVEPPPVTRAPSKPIEPIAPLLTPEALEEAARLDRPPLAIPGELADAATTFLAFFLANQRQRPLSCEALGVDISGFADTFAKAHIREYNAAMSTLRYDQKDLELIFESAQPHFQLAIEHEMRATASSTGRPQAEACRKIAGNPGLLVRQLRFSKTQPETYEVLMAASD